MTINVAKTAGFCYGVSRAVSICERAAMEHPVCVTLGPIIHNEHVIRYFEEKGIRAVSKISDIPKDAAVVIKSHGVGKKELEALEKQNVIIIDATCPDVKKIHDIVSRESKSGRLPIIIGERSHPEVIAIAGWCENYEIFETAEELFNWLKCNENAQKPLSIVFQTTNTLKIYNSCNEIIKKECTNYKTFDTICGATFARQREAVDLSKIADVMVVVGDCGSANSLKLADICSEFCSKVIFAQSADDITLADIRSADTIGVTAGASTPTWIIKEVNQKMSQEVLSEENGALLENPAEESPEQEAQAPIEASVDESEATSPPAAPESDTAAIEEAVETEVCELEQEVASEAEADESCELSAEPEAATLQAEPVATEAEESASEEVVAESDVQVAAPEP